MLSKDSPYAAPGYRSRAYDWRDDGACRGHQAPDIWFADEYVNPAALKEVEEAKRICRTCPVSSACLHGALVRREPWGIWGGLTTEERAGRRPPGPPRPEEVDDGGRTQVPQTAPV